MKRFTKYLKPYWLQLSISSFLIIMVAFIVGISPYVEGWIITSLGDSLENNLPIDFHYITRIIILLFGFYATVAISRFIFNWLLTKTIQKSIYQLRADVQAKIHRLPVSYFDNHLLGETLGRMTNDIEGISNGVQQAFSAVISAISQLFFLVIIMFYINWNLALIAGLIIPLSFISSQIVLRKSNKIFIRRYQKYGAFNGFVQEKYSGYKEIILFNKQAAMFEQFKAKNEELAQLVYKSNFLSGLLMPMMTTITYVVMILVVFVGATLTFNGMIALGAFTAFIRYVWRLGNPITQLSQMMVLIQSSNVGAKRVFDFLDEKEEEVDFINSISLNNVKGQISFKNVSFSYIEGQPILKQINFEIEAGQTVAIVGPTGSGKTTLINLLMRFYEINEGSIKIDGVNLKKIKKDELRSIFGMVLQDTWLFNGTIYDNIKYSKDGATENEVWQAAIEANVDYFIKTTPQNYQTMISQEADNISQGEKQLLTIARALLANPSILILDEATSTVDTRIEFLIQAALKRLQKDRTSFVIAHRLSTIQNADLILVMNHGEIIERGTHEQLLQTKGFYYELYQSQFSVDE